MRIFLSYASQDVEPVTAIYLALRDQGHTVFFDRTTLRGGDEYHNRIRTAIERAHVFVFLITPDALDAGSYTLTELHIAAQSHRRLLPVMLRATAIAQLPAPLQAVTIHRSDGNLTASVAAEISRMARAVRRTQVKHWTVAAALILVVLTGVASLMTAYHRHARVAKDGAPAVVIPAGRFIWGDDENAPRRALFVDRFLLDTYEITVGRYAAFVHASGDVKLPDDWETAPLQRDADLPVVGVDWYDAEAYCTWAGKRLPTDAEWEWAARGHDERLYPWGNEPPSPAHARFATLYTLPVYTGGVARVGTHAPGASPFAIHDLAGNVAEWVNDWYTDRFPSTDVRNPRGPAQGTHKVIRGGGWYDQADRITATKRMYAEPTHRDTEVGFRCARDVP